MPADADAGRGRAERRAAGAHRGAAGRRAARADTASAAAGAAPAGYRFVSCFNMH